MLHDTLSRILFPGAKKFLYQQYVRGNFAMSRATSRDGVVTVSGVRLIADEALFGPDVVRLMHRGDYEGREARMVRQFLEPSDRVLELGAGLGFIGLLCAKTIGASEVFSFEANPMMEPHIRRHYELNDLHPNLTIGLLSESGGATEATLYVPEVFWAASLEEIPDARPVTTPIVPLNETIAKLNPTFLMMDIEGAEIEIVKSLAPGTIRKIAMETHPAMTGQASIDQMISRLDELGFSIAWRSGPEEHLYFERRS